MDQIWEKKSQNEIKCLDYIKKAAEKNSDIIIFPELTLTGFSMNTVQIAEKEESSKSISFFKKHALDNKIDIVFGLCLESNGKYYNTLCYISHKQKKTYLYRKIHLFSFADENKFYSSGKNIKIVTKADVNLGFTICYDLRFPELFRLYSDKCLIVINIANWPTVRIDHWYTLLKARAIENRMIMVAVNRVGIDDNKIEYNESSRIFDIDGTELKSEFIYKNLSLYKLDINKSLKNRNQIPSLKDKVIKIVDL